MLISPHKETRHLVMTIAAAAVLLLGVASFSTAEPTLQPTRGDAAATAQAPVPEPRLVAWTHPKTETWNETIQASGNIMPWQEIRIGSEVGGLRLASVLVTAGDKVKKGQALAHLDTAIVETEVEAAHAQLAENEANLAQAVATLERGKRLAPSGGLSQQELTLYETQKRTAEARLNAAKAQFKRQQLRLDYATIVAPDDGIIASVNAIEGTMIQAGSDLFRLIRRGRLEWRADVKDESLLKLVPGQEVIVNSPLGSQVHGRIRLISPTIDVATRNGLIYVDLPADTGFKAGLHVTGSINIGKRKTIVLPTNAIVANNGGDQVLCVGKENVIQALPVRTGRTQDGKIEIVSGLDEHARVVIKDQRSLSIGEAVKLAESSEQI